MSPLNEWKISKRIACPDEGYAPSEARFDNIRKYLMYLTFHYRRSNLITEALDNFEIESYNKGFDSAKEILNNV